MVLQFLLYFLKNKFHSLHCQIESTFFLFLHKHTFFTFFHSHPSKNSNLLSSIRGRSCLRSRVQPSLSQIVLRRMVYRSGFISTIIIGLNILLSLFEVAYSSKLFPVLFHQRKIFKSIMKTRLGIIDNIRQCTLFMTNAFSVSTSFHLSYFCCRRKFSPCILI